MDKLIKEEKTRNCESFQKRLSLGKGVLVYIENMKLLKLQPEFYGRSPSDNESVNSDFEFLDDIIPEDKKSVLKVVIGGFTDQNGIGIDSLAFCNVLMEDFFGQETVLTRFLTKMSKKMKKKTIFANERFEELRKVMRNVFDGCFISSTEVQTG